MEIILVRHGETDWNISGRLMGQKDVPLNSRGRAQAETLKEKLADINFDCCYSSPLSRARETAEIICGHRCNIICDDDLKERSGENLEGTIINNWKDYETNKTTETNEEILNRERYWKRVLNSVEHGLNDNY